MDTRIRSILMADFESLTSKSMSCIDDSDPRRAMIAGMLATCMYLLSETAESAPAPMVPVSAEPARPRRDLRREMAGPLPRVEAPFVERPAPTEGQYDIHHGEPEDLCPDCGGPIGAHPIDAKLPWKGDMAAHVACNQDRVYCWTQPQRRPMTAEEAGVNGTA